jgi:hypothetical protein
MILEHGGCYPPTDQGQVDHGGELQTGSAQQLTGGCYWPVSCVWRP